MDKGCDWNHHIAVVCGANAYFPHLMESRRFRMKMTGALRRGLGIVVLILVLVGSAISFLPEFWDIRAVLGQAALVEPDSQSGLTADNTIYLPLVFRDYGPRASRIGFCSAKTTNYADVRKLSAGWYLDFGVRSAPPRPLGMEHVQVIRIHQLTTCWPQRMRDRVKCPYVNPYDYVITSPSSLTGNKAESKAEIVRLASANPGTLWFIGNEMDRRDFDGGGQDEMLPEYYAVVYRELYNLIKTADPTAKIAIGGIIQATPARMDYLDRVWRRYTTLYGTPMPVDVWNVHNFIFKERCNDFGADMPPGNDYCEGTLYADSDHNNMVIFRHQIQVFRQWMKDHNQQQKPLIVSEYGIVYRHADMNNLNLVRSFMLSTFDYFMNTKDCALGYFEDQCRLVQRWAWYSLDDNGPSFNDYAYLINPSTGVLTPLGQAFAEYAKGYLDVR